MQIMVFMRLHSIGQDHWETQATSYSTCSIGFYAPCKGRAILRTGLLDTRMCTFLVGFDLTLKAAESWFIQVDVTSDKSKIRQVGRWFGSPVSIRLIRYGSGLHRSTWLQH